VLFRTRLFLEVRLFAIVASMIEDAHAFDYRTHRMNSTPRNEYQPLAVMLEAFISGQQQSRDYVRSIETEFARHFDEDSRFEDLQYALAMYQGHAADVERLLAASREALCELRAQSNVGG
jgi:hypothetical protein